MVLGCSIITIIGTFALFWFILQNEIIVDYRISWRMTYGPSYHCDNSIIQSGMHSRGQGDLVCFSHCTGTLGPLSYQCTDFSTVEDWSSGKGQITSVLDSAIADFGFVYIPHINIYYSKNDNI